MSAPPARCDIAVIGGGIVGLATAMALAERTRASVVVLEAEARLAAHQTGHNSGVIHSGLYYKPGSLKARNCVAGREALYRFCAEHGIAHERCGKVVLAVHERELPRLEELERRGRGERPRRACAASVRRRSASASPTPAASPGCSCPTPASSTTPRSPRPTPARVRGAGGEVRDRGARDRLPARAAAAGRGGPRAGDARGAPCAAARWSTAPGSSPTAWRASAASSPACASSPSAASTTTSCRRGTHLVRNLIYPVPDPRFPFLGVHFTRMVRGGVEAGPNAVLALKREGYGRADFSLRDTAELLAYAGFWRMGLRHWRMGARRIVALDQQPARSWRRCGA